MDVYDFDGTLYRGDSTADFLKWSLRRHPRAAVSLPLSGVAAVACFGLRTMDKTRFKQELYRFLRHIPDVEGEVDRFWRDHADNVQGPCHPQPGDLVISASPEFLLKTPCDCLGLQLIASVVDPHTGRLGSPNCSGEQKITRFREQFPGETVDNFYSDSRNDDPMAAIARTAHLVNIPQGTILPWPR